MISSSWRRLRAGRSKLGRHHHQQEDDYVSGSGVTELTTPAHFRCPISLDLMKDPVTLSTGITYDRQSIETWLENGSNKTCPVTNRVLSSYDDPIPNHTIRKMIQDWCVQNHSFGIDRIPTPRIPVTSFEASEILSKLILGYKRRDGYACRDLVGRIKRSVKESERNKKCFLSTEVRPVLAAVFDAFAKDDNVDNAVLEDVLSALTLMLPLVDIGHSLGSSPSLKCTVRLLRCPDLSVRMNAVLVLKDVLSSDQAKLEAFLEIEGAAEALFQLIKEPICPAATKASLTIIFSLVSAYSPSTYATTSSLFDMGLVQVIIEGLVDWEKSTSEKALGVLDALCTTPKGRESIRNHELSIPVLVKRMFRVSDLATEFSVSIIWMLSKNNVKKNEEKVLVEALQVGAFQKLLLLLQVGCAERTKEKATELLKMLNIHMNKLEQCGDSAEFKYIKRPAI
uniref:U-box domain-containing protein n=1 Tax=Kalanchoe fedtschenkoi TaxID=63787 RepID=A0A7N0VCB6_KALFE